MAPSTSYPLLLLVSAAFTLKPTVSLVPEKPSAAPPKSVAKATTTTRRDILRKATSAAAIATASTAVPPKPAFALKPNNEVLCGTGFFTNIAQYKCTDIGDISDEGKSRQMSSEEESKLDSLMGKFDLGGNSNSSDKEEKMSEGGQSAGREDEST